QRLGDLRHRLQRLPDPQPLRGGTWSQRAGLHHPAARGLAGEEVIPSPLALKKDSTQCALQSIDYRRKPLGIHEVDVGITLEIADRILERLQFIRHTNRLQNFVRQHKPCSVNLYSLQGRSRLPRPPAPTPVPTPAGTRPVLGRLTCLPPPLPRPFISRLPRVATPT